MKTNDDVKAGRALTVVSELAAGVLRVAPEQVSASASLIGLGLDSVSAAELAAAIQDRLGVLCTVEDVFTSGSIGELFTLLEGRERVSTSEEQAEDSLAVTPAQRRFVFAQEARPTSSVWTLCLPLQLLSPVEPELLERSVRRVVEEFPALSSVFRRDVGGPLIRERVPVAEVTLVREPWTGNRSLASRAEESARRPFDVFREPPFRAELLEGDGRQGLILSTHHAAMDIWSAGRVVDRLFELYAALAGGGAPPAARAIGTLSEVAEGPHEESARYWRSVFRDPPPVEPLLGASVFPPTGGAGVRFIRELPRALVERTEHFSRELETTVHAVLLTSYRLVLRAATGRADVLIGSPASERTVGSTVDCAVNTIPLRVPVDPQRTFREDVRAVGRAVREASRHRHHSFDQLVRDVREEMTGDPAALIQTLFSLQQSRVVPGLASLLAGDATPVEVHGVRMAGVPIRRREVSVELGLLILEGEDRLFAIWECHDDPQVAARVVGMADAFEQLLSVALRRPDAPVGHGEISLFGEASRLHLPSLPGLEPRAHASIERQFITRPDAVAARMGGASLTYRALDWASADVARVLLEQGLEAEAPVAILLEPGLSWVAALLGIWRAGGTYLALDPGQPFARARTMVRAARCKLVVGRAAPFVDLGVVGIEVPSRVRVPNVPSLFSPQAIHGLQLAYIAFTSGSSGAPKGVGVPHAALANFDAAQRAALGVTEEWSVLQLATPGFDACLSDVLMALSSGGLLCIVPRELRFPGRELADAVESQAPSLITATASTLTAMPRRPAPALRAVITTGETCTRAVVERGWGRGSVYNGYGPTEATIGATSANMSDRDAFLGRVASVGRPFAGCSVYVTSEALDILPVGATGELCVGGRGVARGYFDDPRRTAERFLPDPWAEEPGARMYCTGDLGRQRASGPLEVAGRLDRQLQIRGFRVEPGEVAAAVTAQPGVHDCHVDVVDAADGAPELIAYVVCDTTVDEHALRDRVQARLPGYMVPTRFRRLSSLVRGPRGKVDPAALAAAAMPLGSTRRTEAPRAGTEERIKEAFAAVLRCDVRDRDAHFFDLGGHSLRLAELKDQIERRCGVSIPLLDFFQHGTVAELAAYASRVNDGPRPGVRRSDSKGPSRVETAAVAIIGVGLRLPDASNVDELWRNLLDGVESVRFFSSDELSRAGIAAPSPPFVPARAVVERVEEFDAQFFGMGAREAELLDPQHRLLLECAQLALDDAGYDALTYREQHGGHIGAYVGTSQSGFRASVIDSRPDLASALGPLKCAMGSDRSFAATLLGYKLDLSGPCVNVDTACSTSLVAVHHAINSLLLEECDLALAGGASVDTPLVGGHTFEEGGIASPDGHCRPFDRRGQGTFRGMGAAVVVLKRLSEAIADGDSIMAVVRGTAINNDGNRKIGYTAPGIEGQADVVRGALRRAGVEPCSVGYVEAHGTATALGDPIEVRALNAVFGSASAKVPIGSIKGNIGHLDAAAGVVGLLKAALTVERGNVPGSVRVVEPNPAVPWADGPFEPAGQTHAWNHVASPRRAGVSSFGIGGTNAHAIVEQPPEPPVRVDVGNEPMLVVMSAQSENALRETRARLLRHLVAHPDLQVRDVALTLGLGRRKLPVRRALVCRDLEELIASLERDDKVCLPAVAMRHEVVVHVGASSAEGAASERWRDLLGRLEPEKAEILSCCLEAESVRSRDFAIAYLTITTLVSWGVPVVAIVGEHVPPGLLACLDGALPLEEAVRGLECASDAVATRSDEQWSQWLAQDQTLFVDIGDGVQLRRRLRGLPGYDARRVLGALEGPTPLWPLGAVARLFELGDAVDLASGLRVHAAGARRVRLPCTVFERRRHWLEPIVSATSESSQEPSSRALPEVASTSALSEDTVCREIRRQYAHLLGASEPQADADFFALGGDSLTATRLATALRERGFEASARSVVEHATPAGLAAFLCGLPSSVDPEPGHEAVPGTTVAPGRDTDPPPVEISDAQLGLWLAQRGGSEASAFNLPAALHIEADLDRGALAGALQDVLARHSALRSVIDVSEGGRPRLVVRHRAEALRLEISEVRREDLDAALQQAGEQPFDAERELLFRARLFPLGENDHVLLIVMHHLVADGWSMQVVLRDLIQCYSERSQGARHDVRPPVPQFWHYLSGAGGRRALVGQEVSVDVLRDALAGLEPTRLHRDTENTVDAGPSAADCIRLRLEGDAVRVVRETARRHRTTPFVVLLTAFRTVLSRATGQDDVSLVTPAGHRPDSDAEDVVGLFVNFLVLRSHVSPAATFDQAVEAVARATALAFEHAEVPFERLVETLELERSPEAELFPIAFAMRNRRPRELALGFGAIVRPLLLGRRSTRFDLTLWCDDTQDGFDLELEYRVATLSSETVRRLGEALVAVLSAAYNRPDRALGNVTLVADECTDGTFVSPDVGEPPGVLHRVEEQAQRRPDTVALLFGRENLTYRALNVRANRLARELLDALTGPEPRVGILLERSTDLLVAILAVVKAGGAFLPLDPSLPKERLGEMLQSAGVALVITRRGLEDRLPSVAPACIDVGLDADRAWRSGRNLGRQPDPDAAAYVLFTSGSTGRPKGSVVSHRALANRLAWMARQYDFGAGIRILHKTPIGFDVSLWELLCPLISGATMVIMEPDRHRDPAHCAALMRRSAVDVVHFVPSMLQAFLEVVEDDSLPRLRWVICSGEGLSAELQRQFERRWGRNGTGLVNLYGPTEAAIDVSHWSCEGPSPTPIVPIGWPIDNLELYVLDATLSRLPDGAIGELFIAGTGLARGYAGRAELTASAFIANPFARRPGQRMYRTGDLARRRSDGSIEFLGRSDGQVKVRGFRVELGEIQAALVRSGVVGEASVQLRSGSNGEPRITAYVVPSAKEAPVLARALQLAEIQADAFEGVQRLPNRMFFFGVGGGETDFLYDEMFVRNLYLRQGISLRDGACILDVGANTGMFVAQVGALVRDPLVFAYEPAHSLQRALKRNLSLYAPRGAVVQAAVSDQEGTATFTYYPNNTVLSGLHANETRDAAALDTYLKSRTEGAELDEEAMQDVRRYALRAERYDVPCTTLSAEIDAHGLQQIDLLKIDVELSEVAVLRGVRADHWERINQVVAEVQDDEGQLSAVEEILREAGFLVRSEQHPRLGATGLFVVYAVRPERSQNHTSTATSPGALSPDAFVAALRDRMGQQLPSYMVPDDVRLLAELPKTYSGKLAVNRLPDRDAFTDLAPTHAPRNPLETRLAQEFTGVLGLERVDVEAGFFAQGGSSLSAVRLLANVRRELGKAIDLDDLYAHPSVAALARFLATAQAPASVRRVEPEPSARYSPFDLTEVQQAYWLGRTAAFEMGRVATHGYLEIRTEALDLERFAAALNALVARHDMLRAVVGEDGRQRVLEQVPAIQPRYRDLTRTENSAAALQEIRRSMSHTVFDLSQWPCFEVRISRVGEADFRVHFSLDALPVDGVSALVLARDVGVLYERGPAAGSAELPALRLSFRDYVVARQAWRQGDAYIRAREYWLGRLATLPVAPTLPLRMSTVEIEAPRFARRQLELDPQAWSRIVEAAKAVGLTPSSVVLTAYAECLAVWSGQRHFLLNLPISDRDDLDDLGDVVGNFTRTLLLEVDVREADSFRKAADSVQQQVFADLAQRSFDGIEVSRERTRRELGGHVVAPIVFTGMLGHGTSAGAGAFDLRNDVYGITQTPQVLLDCTAMERNGGLTVSWDAIEDAFHPEVLNAMFQAFVVRLKGLAADADRMRSRFGDVPRRVSSTLVPEPPRVEGEDQTLHGLFLAAARRQPQALAVAAGAIRLTYGELLQQATILADRLRSEGVGRGDYVAVLMDKGCEQVVATLAILLCGAAYMPIDTRVAPARRDEYLAAGAVRIVVTQRHLKSAVDEEERVVLCVAVTGPDAIAAPFDPSSDHVQPEDVAYVIFTSGSTGAPKGVVIDHRGAVNTVVDVNARCGIGPADRVLAVSSLGFDLSVYDFFGVLAAGGTVVFPDNMAPLDPESWVQIIRDERVSIWNTVPMLMQHLVEYLETVHDELELALRHVLMSGDWIPVDLPDRIRRLSPGTQVTSLGGATEASIWSIFYPIGVVDPTWKSIPYGKPLTGQGVVVLDSDLAPCPEWVTGELFIAGIGLARGYLGDEALSRARFIRHPRTGERLYRTGDLGRLLPDGNIEFLGRKDTQVKVQGFRLELGEVESLIEQHDCVERAVVLPERRDREVRSLLAFVKLDPQRALQAAAGSDETQVVRLLSAEPGLSEARWTSVTNTATHPSPDDGGAETRQALEIKERLIEQYHNAIVDLAGRLGLFEEVGVRLRVDEIMRRGRVAARYRRWLLRALAHLASEGVVELSGDTVRVLRPASKLRRGGSDGSDLPLLELLTEEVHSAETYADEAMVRKYQEYFATTHETVATTLAALRERWPSCMRVLEVGAGYGSLTSHVLPELPADAHFEFTDISEFFLDRARAQFEGELEGLTFGVFDMDVVPEIQGRRSHDYDMILASSVLHNARDLEKTLRALRSLLAPGGLLLLIEETEFFPFFDLGMGLQQGFDGSTDDHLRPVHPLLDREAWRTSLERTGFVRSSIAERPGTAADVFRFDVIVAQAPDRVVELDAEALSRALEEKLPSFVIPRSVVVLDEIPLNATGKVDRKALVLPEASAPSLAEYQPPTTPVEQRVAEIWAQVLKLERVGREDHFLRLGGDSLLAAKVAVAIRAEFEVEFPIRALFEATLSEVAQLIDVARQMQASDPLEQIDGMLGGRV